MHTKYVILSRISDEETRKRLDVGNDWHWACTCMQFGNAKRELDYRKMAIPIREFTLVEVTTE